MNNAPSVAEKRKSDQLTSGISRSILLLNVFIFVGRYLWVLLACFVTINLSLAAADFARGDIPWAIVNLLFAALGGRFIFSILAQTRASATQE